MVVLRRVTPILQHLQLAQRFYARKTIATTDADMRQVHQQTIRYVYPHAKIKIDSDIYVKVCSVDPHKCPNGDLFIAALRGGPVKNCTASMVIKVSGDERNVEVVLKRLTESTDFQCELTVPVKASLDINTRDAAVVKNSYGDELKVKAQKFINITNARSEKIELLCAEGNINCQGILLGKDTTVETQNKGNIILDKLQGDNIKCKTNEGNITTNCSYVESSFFETNAGNLDLKNVHKKTAVCVHQKGNLKMSGVHGNLKLLINEGSMDVQLSELQGENTIQCNNLTSCIINISDKIEKSTSLDISLIGDTNTNSISLDSTLQHLSLALAEDRRQFKIIYKDEPNILKVVCKSSVTLGKASWMDAVRLQMAPKDDNQPAKLEKDNNLL